MPMNYTCCRLWS